MSLATYPEWRNSLPHQFTNKVILITRGPRDSEFAEDVLKEIRQSGCSCEIVPGNFSDRSQLRKLIQDVLESFDQDDVLLNAVPSTHDFFLRKLTDEEWLAQ